MMIGSIMAVLLVVTPLVLAGLTLVWVVTAHPGSGFVDGTEPILQMFAGVEMPGPVRLLLTPVQEMLVHGQPPPPAVFAILLGVELASVHSHFANGLGIAARGVPHGHGPRGNRKHEDATAMAWTTHDSLTASMPTSRMMRSRFM